MIDIGIASYRNPAAIRQSVHQVVTNTHGQWRLLIVDNWAEDCEETRQYLRQLVDDPRITVEFRDDNIGYVGAVNRIFEWAEAPYIAYVDNDAFVRTPGWNTHFARILDAHHEIAMVFPNGGSYPIRRPDYTEILWGVGCFWMVKKARVDEIGPFDATLGHQEEVDFQQRLRLAGWRMASCGEVEVHHQASATNNPEAQERINQGVINWVNKWNRYFNGPTFNYFSSNVTRFEDWPPNALYIEEWLKDRLPAGLNDDPETVSIDGRAFELVKVPRWPGLYRHRVI